MSEARLESDEIDRDKKGQIMTRIKQLRIHSIPGIFNRLSATSASQILVVKELLDKISAAGNENIPAILRYTLCKIASQLVAQAQSEFFIIEDESQSIPVSNLAQFSFIINIYTLQRFPLPSLPSAFLYLFFLFYSSHVTI